MSGERCGRPTKRGKGPPCQQYRVLGATVCRLHGGAAPQVQAKAAVRAEVLAWQVGTPHADPGETLLRLLTQSWLRAQRLGAELETLVEQHGGSLAAALVGESLVPDGKGGEVKAGEYVRGLATLEAAERERAAKWSTQAIAAGLNKRMVELAERQGQLIAQLLQAVLTDPALGLTTEQRRAVPDVARRHLTAVAG